MSPPQPGLSPVLAVRPFLLAFCRGAILGPGRFLDSLGTSLRPFSRTRGGKGASLLLMLVLLFPFFVLFCGCAPFLEARVGFLAEAGSPSRLFLPEVGRTGRPSPLLGIVIPRGALLARRVGPLHFRDFDGLF